MPSDQSGFIRQLISSQGVPIGIIIDGLVKLNNNGGGLILTDSSGQSWLFTVGTDGRLNEQGVTF